VKVLVCGSRNPKYDMTFFGMHLILRYRFETLLSGEIIIIEGCCPNSADEFAEKFCTDYKIPMIHYPAKSGEYLQRDRDMVNACDEVMAYWDGKSRGTKYTIDYAKRKGKEVTVVHI
jgi:hypothetical protein